MQTVRFGTQIKIISPNLDKSMEMAAVFARAYDRRHHKPEITVGHTSNHDFVLLNSKLTDADRTHIFLERDVLKDVIRHLPSDLMGFRRALQHIYYSHMHQFPVHGVRRKVRRMLHMVGQALDHRIGKEYAYNLEFKS